MIVNPIAKAILMARLPAVDAAVENVGRDS
jgi:hypothetical protein